MSALWRSGVDFGANKAMKETLRDVLEGNCGTVCFTEHGFSLSDTEWPKQTAVFGSKFVFHTGFMFQSVSKLHISSIGNGSY